MKSNEFITEAATWGEKEKAYEELAGLFRRVYNEEDKTKLIKDADIPAVLQQVKGLLKITGRAYKAYNKGWGSSFSAGYMFDNITIELRKRLATQGNTIFPDSSSAKGFARQLAAYYGGQEDWRNPTKWTSSAGGSYSDPENHVKFDSEDKLNDVWEDLQKHGKKVYIKNSPSGSPQTYIKIGSLLIANSSRTRDVFSNKPNHTFSLSIQTTKILKNWLRSQQDITDQQAASLQDIAATKNANAMAGIKAIMSILRGEQEVQQVIANSKKITPTDKAKLDAIIAGAKNFKEPQ